MKKRILAIIVGVLALVLCACSGATSSNDKELKLEKLKEKDFIGDWISSTDMTGHDLIMHFEKGGVLKYDNDDMKFKWSYKHGQIVTETIGTLEYPVKIEDGVIHIIRSEKKEYIPIEKWISPFAGEWTTESGKITFNNDATCVINGETYDGIKFY